MTVDIRVIGDNTEEIEAQLRQPLTPLLPLEDAQEEIIEETFPELNSKQKFFILQELGFVSVDQGLWHHPGLGPNTIFDTIQFDLDTDKLDTLIPKVFVASFGKGQFEIRHNLKRLLDIR